MRTVLRTALLLIAVVLLLAGCGDGDAAKSSGGRSSDDAAQRSSTRPSGKHAADADGRDDASAGSSRMSPSPAAANAADVATCLTDAGFVPGPPAHGVSQQWSADDGSIVALSSDPGQARTIASELHGEVVGSAGYVVAGDSAIASAGRACASRAAS